MPIPSWSNPSGGSGVYASEASKGAQINPINIAGLVAAIIQNKQHQQAQQQQAINQITSGISSIGQAYQGGQADDLANRALYQARYPGDTTDPGTPGYDNRVPDYGGTQGLQSQRIAQQLQDEQALRAQRDFTLQNQKDLAPLNAELLRSRINDTDAQAAYRQRPMASRNQDKEQRLEATAALDAAKRAYAGETGVRPQDLSKIEDALNSYVPGKTAFPEIGTHKAITDESGGEYKDRVLSARDQYRAALDKLSNLSTTPQQQSGGVSSQIAQIKSAYSAGQMSRAEASAALQALGIAP